MTKKLKLSNEFNLVYHDFVAILFLCSRCIMRHELLRVEWTNVWNFEVWIGVSDLNDVVGH